LARIDRLDLLPALFDKVYVAEYLGLNITGTLGVLIKAKALGLISSFVDAVMEHAATGDSLQPEVDYTSCCSY